METSEETLKRIKGIKVTFSDYNEDECILEFNSRYFIATGTIKGSELEFIDENGESKFFFNSGKDWTFIPYINFEDELINL